MKSISSAKSGSGKTTIQRKTVLQAMGAAAALGVLAACGKNEETPAPTIEPAPAPSDGGGDVQPPVPVEKLDYSKNDNFGIVLSDKVRTDAYGEYRQLTTSPESPLMNYDDTILEDHVLNAFTVEEVESAQQFASTYVIEQIDSTLLWDNSPEAKEEWIAENRSKFDKKYHAELEEAIRNPKTDNYEAVGGNAQGWKDAIAEPIYVADQPRLVFTNAQLVSVNAFLDEAENNEERIRFDYECTAQEDIYNEITGVLILRSSRTYVLKRDGEGGWLITAWVGQYVWETVSEETFDPEKEYAQHPFPEMKDSVDEEANADEG